MVTGRPLQRLESEARRLVEEACANGEPVDAATLALRVVRASEALSDPTDYQKPIEEFIRGYVAGRRPGALPSTSVGRRFSSDFRSVPTRPIIPTDPAAVDTIDAGRLLHHHPPDGDVLDVTPPLGTETISERSEPRRPCLVMITGAHLGEIFAIERELIIGRDPDATICLADDEAVSRRHACVAPFARGALLTDLGSLNGTFVDGKRVRQQMLEHEAKIRIGANSVLRFNRYDATEEGAQRRLLELALQDGLTRAFNSRYLLQRLMAEVQFAARHQHPLALLLIDIDHFKLINDRFGHQRGDRVLQLLVEALRPMVRGEDVLARYGGDEFVLLVRGIEMGNAMQLGERVREHVAAIHAEFQDWPLGLTASVGVGVFPFPDAPDPSGDNQKAANELLARADTALYRAKAGGRNRVEPFIEA